MQIHGPDTVDADRLRAIRLRALADAPDAFYTTLEQAEAFDEAQWIDQLDRLPTFVAEIEGGDIAMVRGKLDDNGTDAWLLSMWVAPEARGQGVGDRLVDTIIEWAISEGRERLLLEVTDKNAGAIRLYDRKGFKPTGRTGPFAEPRAHISEHERALELTDRLPRNPR